MRPQVQVRAPGVLVQAALGLQPPLAVAHSSMSRQAPALAMYPVLQVKPQVAAAQVDVDCAGWGHTLQREPQEAGAVSVTQAWPQACWPVAHSQVPALHVAPDGQSFESRQPDMHFLEMGSQKYPAPQPWAWVVQSLGSTAQVPRLHTWPWPQA